MQYMLRKYNMKILFIRTAKNIGGAEILTRDISESLNTKQFEIYNLQSGYNLKTKGIKYIEGKTLFEINSIKSYIIFYLLYIPYLKNYKIIVEKNVNLLH